MSSINAQTPFAEAGGADAAVPGDPFTRVRYHHGQLLGVDDFLVEQQSRVLLHRLHLCLQHGAGTVLGLWVDRRTAGQDADGLTTHLTVAPGLAVDAIGRELYLARDLCLDVRGLHLDDVWPRLTAVDPDRPQLRTAYAVARYLCCARDPVPTLRPACSTPDGSTNHSRLVDTLQVDLEHVAPERPDVQFGAAVGLGEGIPGADGLLRRLLTGGGDLPALWTTDVDAALLLAEVLLEAVEVGGATQVRVVEVHNHVRALLPVTRDPGRPGPQLEGWTMEPEGLLLSFTRPLHPATVFPGPGVRVLVLEATGWRELPAPTPVLAGRSLRVPLPPELRQPGVVLQVLLAGESAAPLLSTDLVPLCGRVDDPMPPSTRGRDVSLVFAIPEPGQE